MARQDLSDAVAVGIVNANFDAVGHRNAGGVGIDGLLRMQRVSPERLGLAVERAQGDAHGAEELECIRAERRASGCSRAQAGKAQPVTKRAEQQSFCNGRMVAAAKRRKPGLHPEFIEPLLERRGVHDASAHVRGDRFPHPRSEQHEGRRDLAEIVHHRLGLFDEVDLHPAQQPFAECVDLLHDPGQRQHRDIFVFRPLRIEREIGRAMPQHAAGCEHRKLGVRGRA